MLWPTFSVLSAGLLTLTRAVQVPFQAQQPVTVAGSGHSKMSKFELKYGPDRFSPKDLISLSRPGIGVANPEKEDLVFVPVSKYSFEGNRTNRTIYIAPIASNVSPVAFPILTGGEAFWLDSRTLAHVVNGHIYGVNLEYKTQHSKPGIQTSTPPYLVGTFPPSSNPSNFKFSREAGILVFSAAVYEDYDLRTIKDQDEEWENRGTTARVYDELFVRHWDEYRGPKRSRLFSVDLRKSDDDGKWRMGDEYYAPMKGTEHFTPVEPFGGSDDFDISPNHIAYTTKDPSVNEAWHTRQNVYLVPLKGGAEPRHLTSGKQGATHSVVLSAQGDKAAWTEMEQDGYEADRAKIVIYDLDKDVKYTLTERWDRSAGELAFSKNGKAIFFVAGDEAQEKIYLMHLPETPPFTGGPLKTPDTPIELVWRGSSHGIQPLSSGRLLFTKSSLTSPNNVFLLTVKHPFTSSTETKPNPEHPSLSRLLTTPYCLDQVTKFAEPELKGRSLDAGKEFWFEGGEQGRKVHGWALHPAGYDKAKATKEGKRWPAVFLIHGGPQSAWENGWSTRWNPNVFAGQGYFVIAINPTGSTSFGQNFTDAIAEDWGGAPFVDLKKGWDHALKIFDIDPERTVAAGASWGGFAINWIQGHPDFGFGFKALVCHDGIFDTRNSGFSTDELYFWNHEFGGRPWEQKAREIAEKFNPSNFVHKWSTPELIIHGGRDYRLAEPEGLAAFNALQERGVKSRLVLFPDENHWVLNPGNSYKWHYEVFRWIDEHIGKAAGYDDDVDA